MQLSLHTDYALRTLMTLASLDRQFSVEEIAQGYGISRNHLAKVVQRLQAEGYVATFRGRGGGIRLAKPAHEIAIGEVVRRFETLDSFVACFAAGSGCRVGGACGLKGVLAGALEAFLAHLDEVTLADLVPDRAAFFAMLDRPVAA